MKIVKSIACEKIHTIKEKKTPIVPRHLNEILSVSK